MAVPFQGYFISRITSALCPITTSFNLVGLQDVTVDHLLMDKGDYHEDTNETIVYNQDNLSDLTPAAWHPDTELNLNCNSLTLEGGPISNAGNEINFLAIKRTSNRSNFKLWEDLAIFSASGENAINEKQYDDIFIESGIIYRYAIQAIAADGTRGPLSNYKETILDYEHCWLIGEEQKQLMFAYNPVISNYTIVKKETMVETLDSKFPFTIKNTKAQYKQFSFSATITHFIDVEDNFINYSNMFLDSDRVPSADLENSVEYSKFFKDHGMEVENNYIIEREFRNKLYEFIYNGKNKVFKSDTEGLMLVNLSAITLSPKTELGRTVYDLSCTITEIAEVNRDSLIKNEIKEELI